MHYQEKELDTFPTTYIKDYKWFKKVVKSKIRYPVDTFALPEEERNNYIRMKKDRLGPEELESVKQLYLQRLQSTYKVSYCDNLGKDKELLGKDTMMVELKKLYSKPTKMLLPPVPTSRRVLGYCRPSLYYTELSEYQGTYSFQAYKILRDEEEKGISRVASRIKC